MKYNIADNSEVTIEPGDRVVLIDQYAQGELSGELLVVQTLETILIVQLRKNDKNQAISPESIKEAKLSNKVTRQELRPLIEEQAEPIIAKEVKKAVKAEIEKLVTQKFFDDIAKDALKVMVRNELGLALRQAANAIDPPKGGK